MMADFWNRWSKEVLYKYQRRPKWLEPEYNIKGRDLVLMVDNFLTLTRWSLVTVKIATPELQRPIVKLIHLPLDEEAKH